MKDENGLLSRQSHSLFKARCSPKLLVRIGIVSAAATAKAVLGSRATAATKIPSQIQSRGKAVTQRNIPVVLLFLGLAIRGAMVDCPQCYSPERRVDVRYDTWTCNYRLDFE